MYELTSILKEFIDLLKSEKDADTKQYLITSITDIVTTNYTMLQNENHRMEKDNETKKYKNTLIENLKKIESEIESMETNMENNEYSIIENKSDDNKSDPGCYFLDNDNKQNKNYKYMSKLDEASSIRYELDNLEYPIYNKEQEYIESINTRINSVQGSINFLNSCRTNNNTRIDILEKSVNEIYNNEMEIYRNINDIRDNERDFNTKLGMVKENTDNIENLGDNIDINFDNLEFLKNKLETVLPTTPVNEKPCNEIEFPVPNMSRNDYSKINTENTLISETGCPYTPKLFQKTI